MRLTIDNRDVQVESGATLLHAAEANGFYIPHLCHHPELKPYGGCRLCIVEVEGMRGYPTACTTLAEEGMVVRTVTRTLQEMRREILQLILSEHPAACLVCEEAKECACFTETIRKVGATTGCRWCPKDRDCELQAVADFLALDGITFPVYYRGLALERDDPFFDRDHNLCIYCARCTRICQEHRRSAVIALNQRGRFTVISPSFEQSHVDAGCEFCGACVSVCPTGALSEKMKKWSGTPEAAVPGACPLCSLGCDLQLLTRKDRLIGTLPPGDPRRSGGELCVKGRFCLAELLNLPDRAREPRFRFPEGVGVVTWEEAVAFATGQIRSCPPERLAVYLSPHLEPEALRAADRFFREGLGVTALTSSVLDDRRLPFLALAEKSVGPGDIEQADALFSVFFDGNYGYAPSTLAVKRAAGRGVPYFQAGWLKDPTSRFATRLFAPPPERLGEWFETLDRSVRRNETDHPDLGGLVRSLRVARAPLFLVGAGVADLSEGPALLKALESLAEAVGARVHAPHPFGDVRGLVSTLPLKAESEVLGRIRAGKIDLLYLVGDGPFDERPPVRFVLLQSAFPRRSGAFADLLLPAAAWGETTGNRVVAPPGKAESHAAVFARLHRSVTGREGDFTPEGLSRPGAGAATLPRPGPFEAETAPPPGEPGGLWLTCWRNPHVFLDAVLNASLEGLSDLVPTDTIALNPADTEALGLKPGNRVEVASGPLAGPYPFVSRPTVLPGFAFLIRAHGGPDPAPNPSPVNLRRHHA